MYASLAAAAVLLAELSDLGLQAMAQRALVARAVPLVAMLRAKALLLAGFAAAGVLLLVVPATAYASLRPGLIGPLVAYFVLAGWSELFGVALRARGRRGGEAATILCFRATTLVLVALTFSRGLGLAGLVWALALSPILALVVGASLLRAAAEPGDAGVTPAPGALLAMAFPLAVNGALALLSLRVEILALTFFAADYITGLFAAALKLVDSLVLIPAAIATGAMPALTREASSGGVAARERTAATVALLGVPASVGIFALAPAILGLLREEYVASATTLRILAPAVLAMFVNNVLMHALLARGRNGLLPRLSGARVGAALVCALVLIPRFSASGAAAGFTLSELLLLALAARACVREGFAVPVLREVSLAAALSVPMALVVATLAGRALIAIPVGALTYGATLLVAWRFAPRLAPLGQP